MIPHRTPSVLPWLYPSLTWRMPADDKRVYLTFDDGPVPGPTEFVIDLLARLSIPATFFCIGENAARHPDIFRSVIAGGHAVGNHTANHVNGWSTSLDAYIENARRFEIEASEAGLPAPAALFRPPYGRITGRQIKALSRYRIVMWDVLSRDYDASLSPEKCLAGTLKACRPGSIIVFHDSYKSQRNMEYVLPRLIDKLANEGYSFGKIES